MQTYLLSEGKNVVIGERYFTRAYAVPIIIKESVIRWIEAKVSVADYSDKRYRILRVQTLCEMEFSKCEKLMK